jgi:D-alanyl-D-alanine carboxypeptidase (penicillin-binding protein 5/6)
MRRASLAAAVSLLAVLVLPVRAAGEPREEPALDAAAWYLVGEDGVVLARRNARRSRAIASITKLMTTLVALEHARPSEVVDIPASVVTLGGSTIYLQGGEQLTVAELVRAALIPSANDAAAALALHVGEGSILRFVAMMNLEAAELGLTDTTFTNPHGLDEPGHVSSARDATLLLRRAIEVPLLRDALSRTSFEFEGRTFLSTDDLNASWPPLLGAKTGHTEAAGWSEVGAARVQAAKVYGAVLGTDTREERDEALHSLLSFGLSRYRSIAAIDANRVYATAETGYGRPDVDLVSPRTIVAAVHESATLVERVVAPRETGVPVREGQVFGRVEVWDGDRLVASSNLVAASDVSEPGVIRKALWLAGETLSNLWGILS